MKLSAAGRAVDEKSEGFRSRAYRDIAGLATIGYGHKIRPNEAFPPEITEQKAEALLQGDVSEAEQAVIRLVKVPLTQGQFDALVDFAFNLGAARLQTSAAIGFSTAKTTTQPRTTIVALGLLWTPRGICSEDASRS